MESAPPIQPQKDQTVMTIVRHEPIFNMRVPVDCGAGDIGQRLHF